MPDIVLNILSHLIFIYLSHLIFFFKKNYLFFKFQLRLVLVVARRLQSTRAQQLWHVDSLVVVWRLSSCGVRTQLPCSMWDLSCLTRGRTWVPCIGRWILNRWTTREVPSFNLYKTPMRYILIFLFSDEETKAQSE